MEVEIVDLGMFGEGVANLDGKIILVPNALLNEIVDIEITNDYGNYAKGKLLKIIKKSDIRRDEPCKFSSCGGCALMHMDYDYQLIFKQNLIKKTLKKIANIDNEPQRTIPSDKQFNFRNKISFSAQNTLFGMKENHSNNVIDITNCLLATDKQNKIFNLFKSYCLNNNLLGYDTKTKTGVIKNLVIKDFPNGTLVAVVSNKALDLNDFYKILSKQHKNVGLFNIINKRKDSVVLSGEAKHIAGLKELHLNEFGFEFPIDIFAFHQTNNYIQNKIYSKILDLISADDIIINGFSGAGVLSAIMSKKSRVIGVEIDHSAHASAERLKKINKIENLTNICGDFNKVYKKLIKTYPEHSLVLDPSKKGLGKIICDINRAKSIIYLSCNPIALAKDLRELIKYYIIDNVIPFDMFPNTTSVETLVILKRRNK